MPGGDPPAVACIRKSIVGRQAEPNGPKGLQAQRHGTSRNARSRLRVQRKREAEQFADMRRESRVRSRPSDRTNRQEKSPSRIDSGFE
jgi:hypothetical protein